MAQGRLAVIRGHESAADAAQQYQPYPACLYLFVDPHVLQSSIRLYVGNVRRQARTVYVGLTALFMLTTSVLAFGVDMLVIVDGKKPGT